MSDALIIGSLVIILPCILIFCIRVALLNYHWKQLDQTGHIAFESSAHLAMEWVLHSIHPSLQRALCLEQADIVRYLAQPRRGRGTNGLHLVRLVRDCELLLESGALINATDDIGRTPLDVWICGDRAARRDEEHGIGVALCLISNGACVSAAGLRRLHAAGALVLQSCFETHGGTVGAPGTCFHDTLAHAFKTLATSQERRRCCLTLIEANAWVTVCFFVRLLPSQANSGVLGSLLWTLTSSVQMAHPFDQPIRDAAQTIAETASADEWASRNGGASPNTIFHAIENISLLETFCRAGGMRAKILFSNLNGAGRTPLAQIACREAPVWINLFYAMLRCGADVAAGPPLLRVVLEHIQMRSVHARTWNDAWQELHPDWRQCLQPFWTASTRCRQTINEPPVCESCPLPLSMIHYSQSTMSDTFQDGTRIEETIAMLRDNPRLSTHIRTIKVVAHGEKRFTMDNRRLFCFKQALSPATKIEVLAHTVRSYGEDRFNDKLSTTSGGHVIDVQSSLSLHRHLSSEQEVFVRKKLRREMKEKYNVALFVEAHRLRLRGPRQHLSSCMSEVRAWLSDFEHVVVEIDPRRVGAVIGTQGATVRRVEEETEASITVRDTHISICGRARDVEAAAARIRTIGWADRLSHSGRALQRMGGNDNMYYEMRSLYSQW